MAAAHPFVSFVGCRFKRIGIAHFARLQETTSQCALTLCHIVLRVLHLLALVGPALRPPASQCAPGLNTTHSFCRPGIYRPAAGWQPELSATMLGCRPVAESTVAHVLFIDTFTHSGFYPAVSDRSPSTAVSVEYLNLRVGPHL